jgi:hypothetical protein
MKKVICPDCGEKIDADTLCWRHPPVNLWICEKCGQSVKSGARCECAFLNSAEIFDFLDDPLQPEEEI